MSNGIQQQEEGYIVLITILVMGAVLSIIAGFLLLTGQNASIASNSVVANANAKAAATGCAELALSAILANPTSPVATLNQTVNSATSTTCTYAITGVSPNFTITTTGTVTQGPRSYVHRLTLTTNQVSPQINVTSWQDSQ
jgi:hypothetical protein